MFLRNEQFDHFQSVHLAFGGPHGFQWLDFQQEIAHKGQVEFVLTQRKTPPGTIKAPGEPSGSKTIQVLEGMKATAGGDVV